MWKVGDKIRFRSDHDFIYEIYTIIEQNGHDIQCGLRLIENNNPRAIWAIAGNTYMSTSYSINAFELIGERRIRGKNLPHKLTTIFK